jgi:hypothetical protein
MRREAVLWMTIFTGPIVWLLNLQANFTLAPWACAFGWKLTLHLISAIALCISAGSGIIAWIEWRRLNLEWPGEAGGIAGISRSLAMSGVLLSAMFFLVILAQAIPQFILEACE